MFFRRMFSRKDDSGTSAPLTKTINSNNNNNMNRQNALPLKSPKRLQRRLSSSDDNSKRYLSVLQLTPLWEHIIRTRTLPEDLNPMEMFEEFLERLKDPEWQVRQHALKVLVDVLAVIGPKADAYFGPLIPQLVENLGHPAPTVRKGALDCLRVYIVETARPENILLEILDIGLNQKVTNEPFGGRLTCGVMLSLPSLIQATLHTPKRNYILRSTIEILVKKMTQITHQEITLKVLLKLKELVGPREFSEYMTHNTYREFDLLCNVYGVGEKNVTNANRSSSWKISNSFENNDDCMPFSPSEFWRPLDEEFSVCDSDDNTTIEKVIMETEIKINDDTLTMRILETSKNETEEDEDKNADNSSVDDTGDDESDDVVLENSGLIQVLTDSELEEINKNIEIDDEYVRRTPKRVTFGGEIVKMRTPDSDTITHSDGDVGDASSNNNKNSSNTIAQDKLSFLTVEIPNDNTKPLTKSILPRPKSAAASPSRSSTSKSSSPTPPLSSSLQNSPKRKSPIMTTDECRPKSDSPRSPFRRINISPVDSIISPRSEHKEIEVLHNLQRSPSLSPQRFRKTSLQQNQADDNQQESSKVDKKFERNENRSKIEPSVKSWEELGIVDKSVIRNLKSGDWRLRSHAICEIEEALKSSENLALVQSCLDSLLRTLLSSEKNLDLAEDKRRVIMNLISRLPLDNLEDRIGQIITGLCRQGGAGSNRVLKALMQRLPPAVIVLKLLCDDFLHARSSRFRENALQMVMYALMTFPSTLFDTKTCVTRATYAALDRKRRVRQASLDVLAVLGQVTSPKTVMEIVQSIANNRENGMELCKAVKARLARKQLPIISPDGLVQYALRIPSPQTNYEPEQLAHLGADIEWIASGIGSVSPTSLKRRSNIFQSISTNTNNTLNGKIYGDPNRQNNDDIRRQKAHNGFGFDVGIKQTDIVNNRFLGNTTNLDNSNLHYPALSPSGIPMQVSTLRAANGSGRGAGDVIGIYGKRIGTKSCSDSSQDGRSSDSTSGNGIRTTRLPVTSRFPAMERLNVTDLYVDRQSFRNPYDQQMYISQHGFNSTFPKANFSVYQKKIPKTLNQDAYTESSSYSNGNSTNSEVNVSQNQHPKRFLNVEKFITQSNKQQQHHSSSAHQENGVSMSQSQENIRKVRDADENSTKMMVIERYEPSLTKSKENLRDSSVLKNENHTRVINLSEISSSEEKTSSSGHSTPTRVITVTSGNSQDSNEIQTDKSPSNKSLPGSNQSSNYEEIKNSSRPQSESSSKSLAIKNSPEVVLKNEKVESPDKKDNSKEINEQSSAVSNEVKSAILKNQNSTIFQNLNETESKPQSIDTVVVDSKPDVNVQNENIEVMDEVDNVKQLSQQNQMISENITEINVTSIKSVENESLLRSPVPTMEVKPITRQDSVSKSSESIFEPPIVVIRQDNNNDTKSNASTETSSDYQASHAASLDNQPHTSPGFIEVKPQHTPLIRKSKTTFINRNRRISPVKQSIKLNKTEGFPSNLTHFDKPKEAISVTINQLDSQNWETIIIGLRSLVRLMRHHPDLVDTHIHMVCMQLSNAVRNLRSQVSRAACQASTELFGIRSKYLENECDDLVGSLLHRTADTNRFLRADATRALESMCDNLTPSKVLHLLTTRGIAHQNALVRTTTAKILNRLADRLGCDRIFNMNRENRDKFILTGAALLLEGSLETRCYAKTLFRLLSEHHNYNKILLEVIPSKMYRNIEKTLKSIR